MPHYKAGDEPVPGYRLEKFLGEGGFGEVWKATGPGQIHVAVKIIGLDREQGLKEFRALWLMKGIHHPNLVPIMGSWLIGEHGNVLSDTQLEDLSTSKTAPKEEDFLSRIDDSAPPAAEPEITVLLIDDQPMVGEAVRRMLADEPNIVYHYCGDPANAVQLAHEISPTVILQDLVMPDVDGLTLVEFFRAKPATRDIPLIVLSTKEDPTTKAEAFALGANDYLVKLPDKIELIARIRRHSNNYLTQLQRSKTADTRVSPDAESASPRMLVIAMGLGECNLGDRLEQSPSGIPPGELIEYMHEAAKAIDFMNEKSHDLGGESASIQHCDIKPQNILIVGGSAQVCDFGLARVLGDVRKTSMGVSPAYGAPECLEGNKPSASTDQYSLAISFVELRTGKLPFEDVRSYLAILNAHLDGKLDLSGLPPEEQRVIEKATSRDPSQRYESASAMVHALREAMLKGSDAGSIKGGKRPRRLSRHALIGLAGLALVILVFAAMLLGAWRVETKAESLTRDGQYQEAFDYVESCSPWVGWAVAKDRLRDQLGVRWCKDVDQAINEKKWNRAADLVTDESPWIDALVKDQRRKRLGLLKKRWYEESLVAAALGEKQRSDEICRAVLVRFPDHEDAGKTGAGKLVPGKSGLYSLPPDTALAVVRALLDKSWAAIDSNPAEGAEKCGEARKFLDASIDATAEDKIKQEAQRLRREVLLLGARANSRRAPPRWDAVHADLQQLAVTPAEETGETPGQTALQAALELTCEEASPSRDFDAVLDMLDRCKKRLAGASGATGEDDRWAPTKAELANADAAEKRLVDRLRESLRKLAPEPRQAIERCKKLLTDFPGDLETVLIKADMEARLKQLDQRSKTLRSALEHATEARKADINTQISILEGLDRLEHVDLQKPEETQLAVQQLDTLRDKMIPELLLVFAERLADVAAAAGKAGTARELRGDCVGSLTGVLPILSQSPELAESEDRNLLEQRAAVLQERWREENRKLIEQLRKDVITALQSPEKPDFANLLRKCKTAERNGVVDLSVRLCQAECLAESAGGEQAGANWQQAARIAPGPDSVDVARRPYAIYIQALLKLTDPKGAEPDRAAALMQQAYAGIEDLSILSNEYRKQRAAQVLIDAAPAITVATSGKSFEELLHSVSVNPDAADKAFTRLTLAGKLAKDGLPPAMKLDLATAAVNKPTPEPAIAEGLLADAAAKAKAGTSTRDDVPALCLLAKLKSQSSNDRRDTLAALDAYAELSRLARQEKVSAEGVVPPLAVYRILESALALARSLGDPSQLGADERKRIGSFYGAKGRLLSENRYEAWPFDKKPIEVALDAYDRAIAYDADSAEYYAGRGGCRLEMDQLPEAEKDAKKAIGLDSKFPGGHALLGNIYLKQSRRQSAVGERLARLNDAVAACTKAVKLTGRDDKKTAYALINRSAANVEICSYSTEMPGTEKAGLLERARDDALRAIEIDTVYNDYAYVSLGNALEDLAYVAGKDLKNYDKAMAAFTKALELSHHANPAYSLARARCAFRAVRYGKRDKKLLASAVKDLEEVIRRDPDLPDAHYWLGRVHLYKKDYPLAEHSLRKSAELDPASYLKSYYLAQSLVAGGKSPQADEVFANTVKLARDAGSDFQVECLNRWASTVNPDHPATDARITALGSVADDLVESGATAPQAKLFIGLVRETQEQWTEAVNAYGEGLASPEIAERGDLKFKLAYRRSKANYSLLLTLKADKSKQTEAAGRIGDRLYLDAEEAAAATTDNNERAAALAQAATARAWFAMGMERNQPETAAMWNKAKELYRSAIKLAPQHPDGWTWRFALVSHWRYHETDLYRKGADNAEAIRYLDEALKSPGVPQRERETIGRMKTGLERGSP